MFDRKAYIKEYQRRWTAARRAAWFAGKKCIRCGSTERLELDHINRAPLPVPCRGCGTILQASYAQENGFCCPVCGREVCWTCGCVEEHACVVEVTTADGSRTATLVCGWAAPGCYSFCYARAAYEFYQEATGRPADDPYYLALAPSVRAVKGLGWGV